jgi:hypothetical protein
VRRTVRCDRQNYLAQDPDPRKRARRKARSTAAVSARADPRVMDTEALKVGASGTQPLEGVVGLEAVRVALKADLSLTAVEVEVVDSNGAGFAFLLGPPSAVDLVLQVIGAISRRPSVSVNGAAEEHSVQ